MNYMKYIAYLKLVGGWRPHAFTTVWERDIPNGQCVPSVLLGWWGPGRERSKRQHLLRVPQRRPHTGHVQVCKHFGLKYSMFLEIGKLFGNS